MDTKRRSLVRRNAPLRALITARLVSSAGTWIAYVALTVDVYSRTHSSTWVSAVLLADFLPSVSIVAVAGAWLDRVPRRTLLIGSEVAAGGVFASLPFAPNAAAIVGLALVAGCASAVFFPSLRATIPTLVTEEELPQANALCLTVTMSGVAAGPVLAGILVAASGVDLPYALNAASFLVSAVLLARLPVGAKPVHEPGGGHWRDVLEGLRVYSDSAALAMLLRVWVLASLGGAAINVGEIFIARQTFQAGTFGFGLLASASGVGLVAGSAIAPRLLEGSAARACRIGLTASAAGFGGAALAPNIWVAAVLAVVGGSGSAVLLSAATLLVQRETDDARRGRAFAIFDGAGFAATGIGMSVSGLAIGAFGARSVWLVAAGLMAFAALSSLPGRKAAEVRRAEPELS
ncbi:MAG TPA: MFS transporter [Gaiellaceae bacterium]|jgi:MFS family permease|nr:MFS transporter [Gaiellaceae bacterium]